MRALLLASGVLLSLACSTAPAAVEDESRLNEVRRDFLAHPVLVDLEADEIYALSDPHGGLIALGELLRVNGLIDRTPLDLANAQRVNWTGRAAVLVVTGDLIDKGPESLGVIDLLRTLQAQAPRSGGRVVVTMGNHEAEFLADARNDKATSSEENAIGINNQLKTLGIDPKDLADGKDREGRGLWMRNLPLGVRIKKWFFSHSGNTDGKSFGELADRLQASLERNSFKDKDILGKDSILEAEHWFGDKDKDELAAKNAKKLDVKHLVFGHDPGAFGDRGKIEMNKDATLIKIDVAMGLTFSGANTGGLLLHVDTRGADRAEVLDARGSRAKLL